MHRNLSHEEFVCNLLTDECEHTFEYYEDANGHSNFDKQILIKGFESDLEIYNYLEHFTGGFDALKSQLFLKWFIEKTDPIKKNMKEEAEEFKKEGDIKWGYDVTEYYNFVKSRCDFVEYIFHEKGVREEEEKPQQEKLKEVESTKQKKGTGTRGKGRPLKHDFKSFMVDDGDGEKLKQLHKLIDGKEGKAVALVLKCALKKGWVYEKPKYMAVYNEFGDIGSESGYNNQFGNVFTDDEIEGCMNNLEVQNRVFRGG